MLPNTRLLIRFTIPNGDMKGWGYDYPHYKTAQQLHNSIEADFAEFPEHTAIHLFYHTHDNEIVASNASELADVAADWMIALGALHGN